MCVTLTEDAFFTQTLYFVPVLSFAVQTKRKTVFAAVPSLDFEDSFRPIAREARAGLVVFRMLPEGASRLTITISQVKRISSEEKSLKM